MTRVSYAFRQALSEVEWQARAGLSAVDDLRDALGKVDTDAVGAAAQAVLLRAQRISEVLWPGGQRVSDRLYTTVGPELRSRLKLEADSPFSRDQFRPWVRLLEKKEPLEVVDAENGPCVRVGDEERTLQAIVAELRGTWGRAADLLLEL